MATFTVIFTFYGEFSVQVCTNLHMQVIFESSRHNLIYHLYSPCIFLVFNKMYSLTTDMNCSNLLSIQIPKISGMQRMSARENACFMKHSSNYTPLSLTAGPPRTILSSYHVEQHRCMTGEVIGIIGHGSQ